jgi:hypothetical protein
MGASSGAVRVLRAAGGLTLLGATGCYHFTFEQEPAKTTITSAGEVTAPPRPTVTYEASVPTYLNGFVGEGRVATYAYCDRPVKTELRVTPYDVFLSMATFLVYTPHTLYVTCEK